MSRRIGRCPGPESKSVVERHLLLPEALAPRVRNTIFAHHLHHAMQTESTNLLALQAASATESEGAAQAEGEVFLAEEQTAGRGRRDHKWYSERGSGIYCSVLLRPQISPAGALG